MRKILLFAFAVVVAALYAAPVRADDCRVLMDFEQTYPVSSGVFWERTVVFDCNGSTYKFVYTQIITSNGSYAGWSYGAYQQDQYGGWTGTTYSEGAGKNPYYTPQPDMEPEEGSCVWMDGQRQCS